MAIAPHTERHPPAEVKCSLGDCWGVQQTCLAPTVSSLYKIHLRFWPKSDALASLRWQVLTR